MVFWRRRAASTKWSISGKSKLDNYSGPAKDTGTPLLQWRAVLIIVSCSLAVLTVRCECGTLLRVDVYARWKDMSERSMRSVLVKMAAGQCRPVKIKLYAYGRWRLDVASALSPVIPMRSPQYRSAQTVG